MNIENDLEKETKKGKDDNITNKVAEMLEDILEELELMLYDLKYLKEGNDYILRIFIDKDDGVSINDCENVSRRIELKLDESDLIKVPYILEVESPGIDRPLRKVSEYQRFKGFNVDISLYQGVEVGKKGKKVIKQKIFTGELVGLIEEKIVILVDGKEYHFGKQDVASCRLSIDFK